MTILDTKKTPHFATILRQQNIPRLVSNAGIKGLWTEKYGEELPPADASQEEELAKKRRFAASEASPQALALLDELCKRYEKTHNLAN